MAKACRLLAAPLALLFAAAPLRTGGAFTSSELLWVTPATEDGTSTPCARLLLLELPNDWLPGDGAAIILRAEGSRQDGTLVGALLAQQAAVLEFPSGRGGGGGACAAAPADPVAEVLGALDTLERQVGAGVVVAIGLGEAGQAVLDAVREEVVVPRLGDEGPRLAAALVLDHGARATFRRGPPPPPEARWPERARLLCAAIAPLAGPRASPDCLAALLPEAHRSTATLRRR